MNRTHIITAMLLTLLCAGCAAPAQPPSEPENTTETELPLPAETGDHVLLTLEATVKNGRVLRLEAVGKKRPDMDQWGVREVRVYDDADLIQTIPAQEAIDADGISGAVDEGYTDCWSPDEVLSVSDMNFDGSDDIGLFGWVCNNTIPYYYWLWDRETEQYVYAFCLQGAGADPEQQEVISEYRGNAAHYYWDRYQYDETGNLVLVRRDVENYADMALEHYEITNGQLTLVGTEALDG